MSFDSQRPTFKWFDISTMYGSKVVSDFNNIKKHLGTITA